MEIGRIISNKIPQTLQNLIDNADTYGMIDRDSPTTEIAMPKFFVSMNYVEAKRASFVIEAQNEDDVYEALGEIDNDFFENHENLKWVCSDYEPPVIDEVELFNNKNKNRVSCTIKQQKQIQREFDKVIDFFNQSEANDE